MREEFVTYSGLQDISQTLTGRETMGIGIRPFGFHAGNMTSIVAYPILLGEELRKQGKEPAFDLHCWFNDVEQHSIVGHDIDPEHDDEANIYPAYKTLQFTPAPSNFPGSVVDYWQPLIENGVREIQKRFPEIKITFHRTSELRLSDAFEEAVIKAIKYPDVVADLVESHLNMRVHRPVEFVRAVCPDCTIPVANTSVDEKNLITINCGDCQIEETGPVSQFDWWLQHRILTLPKLAIGDGFDIWMMGYDHFQERETPVREKLAEEFGLTVFNYTAVHAPLLLSYDGKKMGKSNHNVAYVPLEELLSLLRSNHDEMISIDEVAYSRDIEVLGDIVPKHIKEYKPL